MSHMVVKVGGSLFDWPELGPRLRSFVAQLTLPVALVPGGGALVNVLRHLDLTHGLGEETSHRLALRSLSVAAAFLASLVPEVRVIDSHEFALEDESRPGRLPHSWEATSDSFAARIAIVTGATHLILLKSADPPENWVTTSGYVDPLFATLLLDAPFQVRAINLRRWVS